MAHSFNIIFVSSPNHLFPHSIPQWPFPQKEWNGPIGKQKVHHQPNSPVQIFGLFPSTSIFRAYRWNCVNCGKLELEGREEHPTNQSILSREFTLPFIHLFFYSIKSPRICNPISNPILFDAVLKIIQSNFDHLFSLLNFIPISLSILSINLEAICNLPVALKFFLIF